MWQGFGSVLNAQISYYDVKRLPEALEKKLQVKYKPIEEILRYSNVISLHLPLTPQTEKIIGRQELAIIRPGTLLVNTSRGGLVDQCALAEALERGHLAGAAIDTLSPEPPPPEHPLLKLTSAARDRLIITPHIAGVTRKSFRRLLRNALKNILRVSAGESPQNVVNGVSSAREVK